jgi:hypothetical protein
VCVLLYFIVLSCFLFDQFLFISCLHPGKLEKDVKLFFSPQYYSEFVVTKKKLQQCLDLYKNLEEFKNLFLEFAVEIRDHWFYCKDELEVFHLENFDAKTISVAQYMSKHELELACVFDSSVSEKLLESPSSFPLTIPSIQDLSDEPFVIKNGEEYARVKEVYDLCLSVFEDYEHNLPSKSNYNPIILSDTVETRNNCNDNTESSRSGSEGSASNIGTSERSSQNSSEGSELGRNTSENGGAIPIESKLVMLFDNIVDAQPENRNKRHSSHSIPEEIENLSLKSRWSEPSSEVTSSVSEKEGVPVKANREKRKSDTKRLVEKHAAAETTGNETVTTPERVASEKGERKHRKDKRPDSTPAPIDKSESSERQSSRKERRTSADPPSVAHLNHCSGSSSSMTSPTNSSAALLEGGEEGRVSSPRHLPVHKSSRRKASGPGSRFSLLGSSGGESPATFSKEAAEMAEQQLHQLSHVPKPRSKKHDRTPGSKASDKAVTIEVVEPAHLSPRSANTPHISASASVTPTHSNAGLISSVNNNNNNNSLPSSSSLPTTTATSETTQIANATATASTTTNMSNNSNSPPNATSNPATHLASTTGPSQSQCVAKRRDFQTKRPRRKDCRTDASGCPIYPLVLPNLSTHDLKPVLVVRDIDDFVALMIAYNKYLFGLQDLSNTWNLSVRRLFEFFDSCKMFNGDTDNFHLVCW